MEEITIISPTYLLFDSNLRDHSLIVPDVTTSSLIEANQPRTMPPTARCLNSKVKRVHDKFNSVLEKHLKNRKCRECLEALEKDGQRTQSSTQEA